MNTIKIRVRFGYNELSYVGPKEIGLLVLKDFMAKITK
jgi:hypothetical protein